MWPARHERLNTRIRVCPPLNFDPVYIVHGQSSILLAYSVLCSYECTYLRECVGITSPPVGTALLPRRKRKQISKLVRFIMNTARLSNVIVTDFKFTSFSSGEEGSPHNTSRHAKVMSPECGSAMWRRCHCRWTDILAALTQAKRIDTPPFLCAYNARTRPFPLGTSATKPQETVLGPLTSLSSTLHLSHKCWFIPRFSGSAGYTLLMRALPANGGSTWHVCYQSP